MSDIVMNEHGGRQSRVDARFDLIPPYVLQAVAEVLGAGARKYGEDNWKRITTNEHLNHALNHVNLHFLKDKSGEDHLAHAVVRLMMAYHVEYLGVQIDAPVRKDPTNTKHDEQPSFEDAFASNPYRTDIED